MFAKVLVANRGEIALRIFRTLRELGVGSVAVYSDADRDAPSRGLRGRGLRARRADRGRELPRRREAARGGGPGRARRRYIPATASSPRTPRSRAPSRAPGSTWIGPPPAAIELMGSKTRARQAMQAAGVPIIPGTTDPVGSAEEVVALGEEIGYPLLIKAAAGGGGKGMKVVALGRARRRRRSSRRSARGSRTSPTRRSTSSGTSRTRVTSRCRCSPTRTGTSSTSASATARSSAATRSSSRRRRRPRSTPELRERIGRIAVDAARAAGYRSAGTIEGLLDPDGDYFFMEMNTRIQVEHTVTELVDGPRPRPRAGARRGRASRSRCARRTSSCAATRSSAGSTPRIPSQRLPARAPGGSRATASRRRPGRARRLGRPRGLGDQRPLRPDDREADRARRRPRDARAADAARARRVRDRRRRRRCSASTRRCSGIRASSRARRVTASSSPRSWRSRRASSLIGQRR